MVSVAIFAGNTCAQGQVERNKPVHLKVGNHVGRFGKVRCQTVTFALPKTKPGLVVMGERQLFVLGVAYGDLDLFLGALRFASVPVQPGAQQQMLDPLRPVGAAAMQHAACKVFLAVLHLGPVDMGDGAGQLCAGHPACIIDLRSAARSLLGRGDCRVIGAILAGMPSQAVQGDDMRLVVFFIAMDRELSEPGLARHRIAPPQIPRQMRKK